MVDTHIPIKRGGDLLNFRSSNIPLLIIKIFYKIVDCVSDNVTSRRLDFGDGGREMG